MRSSASSKLALFLPSIALALSTFGAPAGAQPKELGPGPLPTAKLPPGPPPTNVTATPAITSVALSWSQIDGVESYVVERNVPPASTWTQVATVAGPPPRAPGAKRMVTATATDAAVDADTAVAYRVSAYYSDHRLGISAPVTTHTAKPVNPKSLRGTAAPHVIQAQISPTIKATASVAYADVTLAWDPVPGANDYEVSGSQLPMPRTTTGTTYAIPQVNPGVADYQVVARFKNGVRYFEDTEHGARTSIAIGSPGVTGLYATTYPGNDAGTVDFRWDSDSGASDFRLYRADAEAGPYVELAADAASHWRRDRTPKRGKTYFYKLLSLFNPTPASGGVTVTSIAWSFPVRVDVPAAIELSNLRATSPGPGKVHLSWSPVANATSYAILRGKNFDPMEFLRDPSGNPLKLPGSATFYDDASGLWNGATYRYNVCATVGNGGPCAQTTVTLAP